MTLCCPGVLLVIFLSGAAKGFRQDQVCERRISDAQPQLTAPERAAVVAIVRGLRTECSGVVVRPSQVLTAGHCLKNWKELEVRFEDENGCGHVSRAVVRATKHDYLDTGVLELAAPAPPWAIALPLATDELHAPEIGDVVLAAGRGRSSSENELTIAPAKVVGSGAELVVDYPDRASLCRGDSGGPLLTRRGDGQLVVGGLLRGGDQDCRGPDRFTRTHRLAGWINSIGTRRPPGE